MRLPCPSPLLARAAGDPLNADALLVLIAAAAAAVAAALVAAVVVVARRRRHRNAEGVLAAGVVWALVAVAAVTWTVNRGWARSAERERQIESGDLDPRSPEANAAVAPYAWEAVGLGIAYAGLAAWAARG